MGGGVLGELLGVTISVSGGHLVVLLLLGLRELGPLGTEDLTDLSELGIGVLGDDGGALLADEDHVGRKRLLGTLLSLLLAGLEGRARDDVTATDTLSLATLDLCERE